jgi:FlaA1/EpsC-like NDP-sugar epimerase
LVITHPDMTRYFMLIEEAVQLVIQAAIMIDEDGVDLRRSLSTFVLEMGDPVPIIELAQRMIDFYWQDQSKSIGVEFSGLRPGEKLDECLVYEYEEAMATSHPLVRRVYARQDAPSGNGASDDFESKMSSLIELARDHGDKRSIIQGLIACVPGYCPLDKLSIEEPAALV